MKRSIVRLGPVSIVGAGSVGTALAVALAKRRVKISSVISRTGSDAIRLARIVGCKRASMQVADLSTDSGTVLIAVNDASLPEVAGTIAGVRRFPFRGAVFLHTSGVHDASGLDPIAARGAATAAFHPIQSFPVEMSAQKLSSKLAGIHFGTEGSPKGLERADQIAAALESRTVRIAAGTRPLYHIACVFASGYLSVQLGTIGKLASLSGIGEHWSNVLGPLMTSSLEAAMRGPVVRSLTGPIPRGDLEVTGSHVDALAARSPELLPLYAAFAMETARLLRAAGRLTDAQYADLVEALRGAIRRIPAGGVQEKRSPAAAGPARKSVPAAAGRRRK